MNAGSLLQPLGSTMFEEIAMYTGKSLKTLIMFACLVTLALGLASCRKKSSPYPTRDDTDNGEVQVAPAPTLTPGSGSEVETPEQPVAIANTRGEFDIVPLEGVGPIDFGMSQEQVIELWGQPKESQVVALYYFQKGVTVLLDFRVGVREIHCWSKEYPDAPPELATFPGKTDKAITMGTAKEDVIAAYGEPDKVITKDPLVTLRYEKLQMDFVIWQNKLVTIKVKTPKTR